MKDLFEKIILITGGANGIGKETAIKLSDNNTVIVIDNDKLGCSLLNKEHKNIVVYNEDITNYNKMDELINDLFKKYKKIDILINNAAIQTTSNIMDLPLNEWQNVINVNLTATFYMTKLVGKQMKENSTILNIISTHYNKPRVDKLHYDVSKAGVAMLTKGFAMELASKKITVNALAIGATYSPMNKCFEENKEIENQAREKIPLKYISKSSDIATHIYNILQDFSDYTTGSIFVIDGGRNLI